MDLDVIRDAARSPRAIADGLGLEVKRSTGDRLMVRCPVHRERTASCSLGIRDGQCVWHCHGCHEGGDIFALVAAVYSLDARTDFPRIVELAAELVGVQLEAPKKGRGRGRAVERPDPLAVLAMEIDLVAETWLRGRELKPRPIIEKAKPEEIRAALLVLGAADDLVREEDDRLEAAADEIERRIAEREAQWLTP